MRRQGMATLVVALGLAVLAGCGQEERVEVSAPPRPTTSVVPPGPLSTFQGQVAAVDVDAGELVVAVHILWTPALKAETGERRVVVDGRTRWTPPQSGLAQVHVGEDVQVKAAETPDGAWLAAEVMLVDVD